MAAPHRRNPLKEYMINHWAKLVRLYHRTSASSSFGLWLKIAFELCKIIFAIAIRKLANHLFRNF